MVVTQEYCDKLQHEKDVKAKHPGVSVVDPDGDVDSIVSDRCWEEMYRGDSRKWLTRDQNIHSKNFKPTASTMRESYMYPEYEQLQLKGRRQLLLEDRLLQEVMQEMKDEKQEKEVKLDYMTTYVDLHRTPGFQPIDRQEHYAKNKELYEKYPLYKSSSMSYWQFECHNRSSNLRSIPGMTRAKDLKNPFKKNSLFTTPVTEALYSNEQ